MWCHYGNLVDNGAIYGKLYNWFAVKLLQMDIDYYNAANPNAMWGWRVPTQADFNTLATTLGGAGVAGGKMKMQGTTYWNSPNTGADNSSGFSMLQTSYRHGGSGLHAISFTSQTWALTSDNLNAVRLTLYNNTSLATIDSIIAKTFGFSLRLIKTNTDNL